MRSIESLGTLVAYVLPWEFSPTALMVCSASAALYWRGLRHQRLTGAYVSAWRPVSFSIGLLCGYVVMQTYVDYLAQHMFWVHRLQHLVLHHIAPILLVAGARGGILVQGVPEAWLRRAREHPSLLRWAGGLLRLVQYPSVAALVFVGLIYFWLIPAVHFTAMLDARRYQLMNWSMVVDGLLFWWLILTPQRACGSGSVGYGTRILMLCFVAVVQIFIGAYITLHKSILFDVYAICGRAWAIDPLVDQELGGLITWIPPAMMSGIGVLIVLHMVLHASRNAPEPGGGHEAILFSKADE